MGSMYADTMVEHVRVALGGISEDVFSDDFLLSLVNLSYIELATEHHLPDLETTTDITTTSGTPSYEMAAADVMRITDVVDTTNNVQLLVVSRREYNAYTQGDPSSSTGTPSFYMISGTGSNGRPNMVFYPTPAGTYTIRVWYKKVPASLVLSPSATKSVLPPQFDEVIIRGAMKRGHAYLRRFRDAGAIDSLTAKQDAAAGKEWRKASEVEHRLGSQEGNVLQQGGKS